MVSGPPLWSRRGQSRRPLTPWEQRLEESWKGTLEQQDGHHNKPNTQQQQEPHRNAPCRGARERKPVGKGLRMPKTDPAPTPFTEATDGSERAARSPRVECLLPLKVGRYLPSPVTHVVRVAGAAGNDYPQPRRTGPFRGTQGAPDHGPSRVERPHPSLRCRGPPSRSTGAGDRRTREGRLSGKHSSWKHVPRPQRFSLLEAGPHSSLHSRQKQACSPHPKEPSALCPPVPITWREKAM